MILLLYLYIFSSMSRSIYHFNLSASFSFLSSSSSSFSFSVSFSSFSSSSSSSFYFPSLSSVPDALNPFRVLACIIYFSSYSGSSCCFARSGCGEAKCRTHWLPLLLTHPLLSSIASPPRTIEGMSYWDRTRAGLSHRGGGASCQIYMGSSPLPIFQSCLGYLTIELA